MPNKSQEKCEVFFPAFTKQLQINFNSNLHFSAFGGTNTSQLVVFDHLTDGTYKQSSPGPTHYGVMMAVIDENNHIQIYNERSHYSIECTLTPAGTKLFSSTGVF